MRKVESARGTMSRMHRVLPAPRYNRWCVSWCLPPMGPRGLQQGLVDLMEGLGNSNITISATCLYKQYNNGPWWSDARSSGMNGRQRDGKGRSADIMYYHHQGNLLLLSGPGNLTRWMQISFNRFGLGYRVNPVPQVIDVLRYTKECYYWCGTLTRKKGAPKRFAEWLRNFHEPYNGFLLNCLQFSQRVWEFFDADNLGCSPAHLVNEQQFAQEPFPKFHDAPAHTKGLTE